MSDGPPAARRIAITGASGFLGRGLVKRLTAAGHVVVRIGRGTGSDVRWDPATGIIDAAALEGVHAVVHLAAESVGQRWTSRVRRAIRESRVQGTDLIARTIAGLRERPEVLVCSSGIGIYGDGGDEWLDESSPLGHDFLAEVGRAWEAAAMPAQEAGIRVVFLRAGMVLSPDGGGLAKMLLPFQLGIGGPMGSGRQWLSWISREDWERVTCFAIEDSVLRGPVNAVAPEPVTNATFASTLGRVLRRPSVLPVPGFALRALFGEMAEAMLLTGQRARPRALEAAGFTFRHPTLSGALRAELGLAG